MKTGPAAFSLRLVLEGWFKKPRRVVCFRRSILVGYTMLLWVLSAKPWARSELVHWSWILTVRIIVVKMQPLHFHHWTRFSVCLFALCLILQAFSLVLIKHRPMFSSLPVRFQNLCLSRNDSSARKTARGAGFAVRTGLMNVITDS